MQLPTPQEYAQIKKFIDAYRKKHPKAKLREVRRATKKKFGHLVK